MVRCLAILRAFTPSFPSRRSRRGSFGTAMALSTAAVLATLAAAVEFGMMATKRSNLQTALDGAVLAGARDTSAGWKTTAENALSANLTPPATETVTRNFTKAADGTVTGTATRQAAALFGGLLGSTSYPLAATAVAKTPGNTVCILLKGTGSQALLVNSGATVSAPKCQIDVASTASSAAIFNGGSTLNTKKICIAGTSIIDNGGTHPNLATGCTVASDSFAGTLPTPSSATCTANGGNWNGGSITLNPGVYCGWFNLNGAPTVTFNPGVYVIKGGGVNVNGGIWQGTGVTFYFADTSVIQFNSGTRLNLSAPTSGTYAGLLFYEKAGLAASNWVINDSTGHDLSGVFWMPSRRVTINSGNVTTVDDVTMVFDSLTLNAMNWSLEPNAKAISGGGATSAYLSR